MCYKIRVNEVVWPIHNYVSAVSHCLFLSHGLDQVKLDDLTAQSLLLEMADQKDCPLISRKELKG